VSFIANLTTAQSLSLISDQALATTVSGTPPSKTNNVAPKPNLTPVPALSGLANVRPGRLLMQLGKALTPMLPQSDFERSRRWSYYRYFWAFAEPIPGTPLRLSAPANGLRHHHRTLLSEQMGIALALELAQRYLTSQNVHGTVFWTDGDFALDAGVLPIAPGQAAVLSNASTHKMRPDYFFTSVDPAGIASVWAVECKGSHSSTLWSSQLRTAASQVTNVLVDGSPPPGLLFATHLDRRGITVRALDPPSERWHGRYAREKGADPPFALESRAGRATYIVDEPEQFRADLALMNASAALSFAGAYGAAAEALPDYVKRGKELRPLGDEPRDQAVAFEREFVGTRSTLPVRSDLTVAVFTGVERSVYTAAIQRDIEQLMTRGRVTQEALEEAGVPEPLFETDGETYMLTADADGTLFEVRARES
jgi:hypothetical protein